MTTAYLAAEGFEAQLLAELKDAGPVHDRLYISDTAQLSVWELYI
jgi:hypothetical protein